MNLVRKDEKKSLADTLAEAHLQRTLTSVMELLEQKKIPQSQLEELAKAVINALD